MNHIPERDWKFLRSVKEELLEELCQRINDEALRILNDASINQHEKFLRLFDHVITKNEVVADCFDDWRRSTIFEKLLMLRRQQLLKEGHISRLSAETQERMSMILAWDEGKE